MNISRRRR